jgi:hypothetical protein
VISYEWLLVLCAIIGNLFAGVWMSKATQGPRKGASS